MNTILALVVSLAFVALALWHFRMALSPAGGMSGAVPSKSGQTPVRSFHQSHACCRIALLVFALLVAATAGLVEIGVPVRMLSWSSYALALGLLARAVGEFKYIGFFKRVRGTRFARLDTLLVFAGMFVARGWCLALVAGRYGI